MKLHAEVVDTDDRNGVVVTATEQLTELVMVPLTAQ